MSAWHRTTFNDHPALQSCPARLRLPHVCNGPVVERIDDWPGESGPVLRYRAWSAMEGQTLSRRCLGVFIAEVQAKGAAEEGRPA